MVKASKRLQKYFDDIETNVLRSLSIAENARKQGFDPETKVDIPIAKNMAERVIGLISDVAPKLKDSKIVSRIVELEKTYGALDWRVGFIIAAEVAQQKFCEFETKKEAVEIGIRTGFTYLTGGIVSAPLEGFVEVKIKKRADGKEYIACVYAGPIRGAGGTAAATSVVLSDYVASQTGFAKYDPTEQEVNRIVTELTDYHERVTNLQYFPSEQEIKFMISHLPIEVDGDPTERIEVSNYKDLPRLDTNYIRGGVCLVIGEGLCQKSPKIWKRLSKWGNELGIDWNFLEGFLDLQKKIKAKGKKKETSSKSLSPNYTFISDMVAGRPVLTYPMKYGGLRLRMGRTRVSGFSAIALSPYTIDVLDDFIVYGTQLKIERPGKAGSVTVCDSIEGPTVLLDDGNVVTITKETRHLAKRAKKILFLGDILINYGDFSENGHSLAPLGYCEEWWAHEFERKIIEVCGILDMDKFASLVNISAERGNQLLNDFFTYKPKVSEAFKLSKKLGVALHPSCTFYYSILSGEDLSYMLKKCDLATLHHDDNDKTKIHKLVFNDDAQLKNIFEKIGLPHTYIKNEFIILQDTTAEIFCRTFGLFDDALGVLRSSLIPQCHEKTPLEIISMLADVQIKDKGGTFIGARMGRPEKSKMRKLQGSPQVLFPVGDEGGRLRSFQSSMEKGEVTSHFPLYYCESCQKKTIYSACHVCHKKAKKSYFCPTLNKEIFSDKPPYEHDEFAKPFKQMTINIQEYVQSCLTLLNTKVYPDLIKGVKGTSNKDHIPEHLIKGFLRAKHDLYVNKDGTTRYDMSEAPLTAFKPKEIGTPIQKLHALGYTHDIDGEKLEYEDQVVELLPQDVVLPAGEGAMEEQADDILFRTGNFIDELLEKLYKLKPFYSFKSKLDIIGHLVIFLAPHISCGTVGRVIGFTKNQVMAAHPMLHAALRRDCDGDEACFILLMDGFLNFSRQYLPDKRGGRTMDAPLVLSIKIIPSEVDDQVHGMDVVKRYPLELYTKAETLAMPWDVKVTQLKDNLDSEKQYEGFFSTHPVTNINIGPKVSAYKVLPSMKEKLDGQMALAQKIGAVDESNVATMVIQKHFLKDIKGNLRKFSQQQFRCVSCNSKFVRPPLVGKCTSCGGKLLFTISEGSVVKYLESSLQLGEKYNVPTYLKQTLELTKDRVDNVFGKEKEIQEGLSKFF